MYKVLVLLILSLGFHESFQTCSYLQSCTQHLEAFINSTIQSHDISTKISLCLNVVDKQGKLQLCENDAVGKCQLAGHEPEYISYTKQKYEAKKECLKECPKMDEVKICQGEIDYNIIQSSGYSQFCSHYNNLQTTCVDTKLASCSFRSLLFQSGLSEDGKRIVQTICQSGCATIDNTTDAIKSCSRQYSLTPGDDKLLDCSFYDEYISCIQRESPCKEFKRVAEYSQRDISKAREKCESTSSSVAPSTMPTTSTTKATTVPPIKNATIPERNDVICDSDSMSVFVPADLLSQSDQLTWRDPHCKVLNNGTHFISTISHTACGATVLFTDDEVIFRNDLNIHSSSSNDSIDYGHSNDIIPVRCVYPRKQNITTSYRPVQSHVRFYEKRYGHLDVDLEQYQSEKFVTELPGRSFPREVELDKDIFIKLHAQHTNSTDVALKVERCVATPSAMPANGVVYQLIDHGCPASSAIKIYPSSFDEARFSVKAFEFKSNPGSIVYIHCQVSVCSPTTPQCVHGCTSRQRRAVVEENEDAHLVSGGPYLVVADKGSLQMSTVVAAACACLAVIATVFAVVGWRRKSK